ncbi:hypothetical protein ACQT3Z_24105, partial [Klebsiella pneumoniae]
EWAGVYTKVFPAYQLLIESYSKAQDVVKNNGASSLHCSWRSPASPRCGAAR